MSGAERSVIHALWSLFTDDVSSSGAPYEEKSMSMSISDIVNAFLAISRSAHFKMQRQGTTDDTDLEIEYKLV
jgi:hypothetical protein